MEWEEYIRKDDTNYIFNNINPKNSEDIYRVLSKSNEEAIKISIGLMSGFEQQGLLFSVLDYIKSTPKEWKYEALKAEFDEVLETIKQEE